MFRSIKVKFGLFVTTLTTMTIVTISSLILIQERNTLVKEVTQRGAALAQNLAFTSAISIQQDETHVLLTLLNNALDNHGVIEGFFVGGGDTILAHSDQLSLHQKNKARPKKDKGDPNAQRLYDGPSKPRFARLADDPKSKIRTEIRHLRLSGTEVIEFKEPIVARGLDKEIGFLHLSISRRETIDAVVNKAIQQVVMIAAGFLILGILASLMLATRLVKPIHLVSDGAKRIGRGDLDYKIKVVGKDEIGMLAKTFNEMTTKLKEAQLELIEKERLKHELQIAQRIQQSLLPRESPTIPGFALAHFYQATTEVGGDYYDFFPVGDHSLGIVVADVSGKGVPAAILMAVTKSTLRAQAQGSLSPTRVLSKTNSVLYGEMQRGMFVTMFYGILDPTNRTWVGGCAGHNPALVVRAGEASWIRPAGIPLGHDAGGRFDERITEATHTFEPSDVMVFYSDGVTEATNVWGEEFGDQRLAQIVIKNAAEDPVTLLQRLKDELFGFMGGQPQADDISIVVLTATPT